MAVLKMSLVVALAIVTALSLALIALFVSETIKTDSQQSDLTTF